MRTSRSSLVLSEELELLVTSICYPIEEPELLVTDVGFELEEGLAVEFFGDGGAVAVDVDAVVGVVDVAAVEVIVVVGGVVCVCV